MQYRRILTGVVLAAFAALAGFLIHERRQTAMQHSTASRVVEKGSMQVGMPSSAGLPDAAEVAMDRTPAGFRPDSSASGPRATYRFTFVGNRSFSASVLVSALRLTPEIQEVEDLAKGIRRDLKEFYLSYGYLHFQVIELDINWGNPTDVFCELIEGTQFSFGSISVLTSDEGVARAFEEAASAGSPANLALMKRLSRRLTERYQGDGYFDFKTSVEFGMAVDTLDLTAKVDSGQRYLIGEVSIPAGIAGLEPLQLLAGQPYSRSVIEFYLEKARLPWDAVQLHKDAWDHVVDIEITPPHSEESGR